MLKLVDKLFQELNSSEIRYCHWKSNIFLEDFLVGKGDLDLLVDRRDADIMVSLLSSLAFKKAICGSIADYEPISHFYGLDEESGKLVHVHLFYEIITGGSLLKTYCLPLDQMLLSNTQEQFCVKVPSKAAQLVMFVIRMTIKHELFAEAIMVRRDSEDIKAELNWLLEDNRQQESLDLLKTYLPAVDQKLFTACLDALQSPYSPLRCGFLSLRLQKALSQHSRYSFISRIFITNYIFVKKILSKIAKTGRTKTLPGGGVIIAFVGPEATGKSTLAGETYNWLGEHFAVMAVHTGKPPSTWCTFIPNKIMPLLRKTSPRHRTSSMDASSEKTGTNKLKPISLFVYIVRALMVAHDRLYLLKKVSRSVKKGKIAICDRYPTAQVGAMDSPRFDPAMFSHKGFSLFYHLAGLEKRLYRKIPNPDIVIQLVVSEDIAVERNAHRIKEGNETEDYVRRRHQVGRQMTYPEMNTIKIDTDQSIEQTILCIKRVLWAEI